jgi:signal transduction histidine kinase
LEGTFDSPETFIGIAEPDGTLVKTNELSFEFINADAADVLGEPAWEASWWNHSDTAQQKCQGAVERASSGETVRFEAQHIAADSTQISTSVVVRPVMAADVVDKVIIEATDITDLKRREEEIEFFNSILRHDILNEMTVIASRAEMLTDVANGTQADCAETILNWSQDIVGLTQKVRAILNTVSGGRSESVGPVDIAPVISNVVDSIATVDGEFVIETDIQNGIVAGVDDLFKDVIKNIILNAVQHAGSGPTIKVTAKRVNSIIQARIADDGPGIPIENRETVFEKGRS